jgi:signal transduction histidine kinase
VSASSGRRARRSLLVSGVLVAAGIASVGLCVALLGGGPPFPVAVALTAAPVVIAVAAGFSVRACRASAVVLVAASDFAGLAVAVDLGLLLTLLALGRMPSGIQLDLVDPALLGMLLVATLAGPLGRRAGRSARAALGVVRRSPDELVADFGDRASRGEPVAELLRQVAESMRRDWRLTTVQIWSAPDGDPGFDVLRRTVVVPAPLDTAAPQPEPLRSAELETLARAGVAGPGWLQLWLPRLHPGDDAEPRQLRLAPAVHGGRVLALIVIERAADAAAFSASEDRALAEVARRLGIVLRNRALDEALQVTLADLRRSNTDLQASRKRLVTTGNAERRRIERDLHDGAQQHLVALAVGLRLLRDGLPEDWPDIDVLDELDLGVRESIQALRDLAHGIYPPLLRDAGLVEALRAAVKRTPLDVTVVAEDLERLPEPVEVAVYFCCLEALQNAAKHAAGSTVTVTLRGDHPGGTLRFSVTDDGPGFDPATVKAGSGLENMVDRIGAIGGTVALRSAPGQGTTVAVQVPLENQAGAGEQAGTEATRTVASRIPARGAV